MSADQRRFRSGLLFLSAFICVHLWPIPSAFAAENPAKKILLIYTEPDHEHGSHMYEHECRMLAKCLEQTAGVEAEVCAGWPSDPGLLDGAACIVFYSRPAGEIVLSNAHREKFIGLLNR